jgi:peptidoglycan/xylan/chitin deacetylase (PgdA/CDA1 family)
MTPPVFIYHEISLDINSDRYSISLKDFESQVEFLAKNNYQTLSIENYYEKIRQNPAFFSSKEILLTFDDGYLTDFTHVFPLLQRFAFHGNFFITSGKIGKKGFLTKIQIRTLSDNGMSINVHGNSHIYLDKKTTRAVLYEEMMIPKLLLEEILGKEVAFFSFPGGRFNTEALDFAQKCGYRAVFSSNPRYPQKHKEILIIGRHVMKYSIMGTVSLSQGIREFGSLKVQFPYWIKYLIKKGIGNNLYQKLWSLFIK